MSIGGNGANGQPPSPNNSELRQRRTDNTQNADAAEDTAPARDENRSLGSRMAASVRNTLSSPVTIGAMVVGAIAAAATLSWLFGATGGSSGSALTSGRLPDLGGSPPPPPLNHSQTNGAALPAPTGSCPVPTLEEILRNAGYSQAEQQAQQQSRDYQREGARPRTSQGHRASAPAAPQQAGPSLPQCPPEVVFSVPGLAGLEGAYRSSQTREIVNSRDTSRLCSGTPPEASLH
ncbi:MAG: hypothetical protein ACRC7P_09345, partial [Enterovibrio sp.]